MTAARFAVIAAVACSPSPALRGPASGPTTVGPSLPAGFTLDVVVPWQAELVLARLRLDDHARPFLLTQDTIVPLKQLPDGSTANAFRIAGIDAITDLTWNTDGVMLLVVGRQLGTLDEHGFRALVDLPVAGMRVVSAGPDHCWLFAPRAPTGDLYLYDKNGTIAEVVRARSPVTGVSGSARQAVAAIDTSIVKFGTDGTIQMVFDGDQAITAIAASDGGGVFFATAGGTFFLSPRNALTRLTATGARGIEIRGDDVFFILEDVGIVHGAKVSAFRTQ